LDTGAGVAADEREMKGWTVGVEVAEELLQQATRGLVADHFLKLAGDLRIFGIGAMTNEIIRAAVVDIDCPLVDQFVEFVLDFSSKSIDEQLELGKGQWK